MTSVLLTKDSQVAVWKYLSSILEKDGLSVKIMTDHEEFYSYVEAHQFNEIDFVLVDMSSVQLDSFNPYSLFLDEGILIPVVVYNDPFPQCDRRAFYWALKNEEYFNPIFTVSKLAKYSTIWIRLQNLLESPEINPYINCICREKEFSPEGNVSSFEDFLRKNHLGGLKEKLISYLYDRKNRKAAVSEICMYLWNEDSQKTRRHLCTLVHELRNFLKNKNVTFLQLLRVSKETYMLSVISAG